MARKEGGTMEILHLMIVFIAREEITSIGRLAFEAAMKRSQKLTLVDKANVLETSRLWREEIKRISFEYPEVSVDYMFVDAAAMKIVQSPASFGCCANRKYVWRYID